MVEVQLKGVYGTALTVDDEGVTFHAKSRLAKGALGAGERRILFGEITDRSFKPANIATNGHIEIATANGKSIFHFMTGGAARAAKDAFDLIIQLTPDAGVETAGRGLTTKDDVEGATLREVADSLREIVGSMRELQSAMSEERLATLFPGLRFDADTATYQGVTQPIAGASAVVDSAGALSRRPTLTRVALGGILAGPLGAIGGGLLQKKNDDRQVFILIDGSKAAWAVPVKPDQLGDATRFAALFNTAAKEAAVAGAAAEPAVVPAATGLAERLTSLASLHAQGVLSDEEFAQAKTAVLRGE